MTAETDHLGVDCGTALRERIRPACELLVTTEKHRRVNVTGFPACDARYYSDDATKITETAKPRQAERSG